MEKCTPQQTLPPGDSWTGLHMARGSLAIFLAEALFVPTGFVTAVFLARVFGPADYGYFSLVSLLVVWLEWSCATLFSRATIQLVGESGDWQPVAAIVMRIQLVTSAGLAAALWLAAPWIAVLIDAPSVVRFLRIYALDLPIFGLTVVNSNVLIGRGLFQRQALLNVTRKVCRMIFIVLFVSLGFSVEGAICGMIATSAVEYTIGIRYVPLSTLKVPAYPLKKMLAFTAPLSLSSVLLKLFRLDILAVKAFGGSAVQAGLYGAAQNLAIPPTLVSGSVVPPFLSTVSRLSARGDKKQAEEIIRTLYRSVFWLLPFAALMAGASREIATLIYGRQFHGAGDLLSLLIFASLALYLLSISLAVITAMGEAPRTLWLSVPLVPAALLGHFFLVPRFGPLGAAFTTTAVACISALLSICLVSRRWNIHPPGPSVIKCSICAAGVYSIALHWASQGIYLLAKVTLLSAGIFSFFLLFKEFGARERAMFRQLLQKPTAGNA